MLTFLHTFPFSVDRKKIQIQTWNIVHCLYYVTVQLTIKQKKESSKEHKIYRTWLHQNSYWKSKRLMWTILRYTDEKFSLAVLNLGESIVSYFSPLIIIYCYCFVICTLRKIMPPCLDLECTQGGSLQLQVWEQHRHHTRHYSAEPSK